jgi:uncharacterized protein
VERLVGQRLAAGTVRCRVRRSGIVIELDEPALERALTESHRELRAEVERLGAAHGYTGAPEYARYRMGSAFLRKDA